MIQKIHSGLLTLQPFVEVCYHAIVAKPNYIIYTDVDECQNNFGGCSCEPNIPPEAGCFSQCNNTMGSYHCICTQGYVLEYDGLTCQGNMNRYIICITCTLIIYRPR